jgi:ribonucleotide monophosphatase NagD (HAD superfamily)
MSKNIDNEGFKSIVNDYDLFFIDIWGVVHNGVKLNQRAIEVLLEIEKIKKNYVLLTNAPRPNNTVKIFLNKMGLDKAIQEKVYTSGEAALNYLKKNHLKETFYHIGPPRDFDLFLNFKKKKTDEIKDCSYFLCT